MCGVFNSVIRYLIPTPNAVPYTPLEYHESGPCPGFRIPSSRRRRRLCVIETTKESEHASVEAHPNHGIPPNHSCHSWPVSILLLHQCRHRRRNYRDNTHRSQRCLGGLATMRCKNTDANTMSTTHQHIPSRQLPTLYYPVIQHRNPNSPRPHRHACRESQAEQCLFHIALMPHRHHQLRGNMRQRYSTPTRPGRLCMPQPTNERCFGCVYPWGLHCEGIS